MTIGHLRSDDIYNQLPLFPLPKHRSTALAHQAAMLYICLFFSPRILHTHTAVMREIVDKYFPDNWIISIYMGIIVNVAEGWDAFKAAKMAMNNTLQLSNVKRCAGEYGAGVTDLLKATAVKLSEGNVTEESLMIDVNAIVCLLRECNVCLRWLMLHGYGEGELKGGKRSTKQLREVVVSEAKIEGGLVFKLLLNTAQLELVTRDIYKDLLTGKEDQWKRLKDDTHKSLVELSEVFSGTKPLSRIPPNTHLQTWFTQIADQVATLLPNDPPSTRKTVQLIQALEEVQEFHQLNTNMQIVQYLTETRKFLHQMARNAAIKEDVLINLQVIGDLTYAWLLIDSFTPIMQRGIKTDPTLVVKLRAVFLKMASAIETPLLRINQAKSEDLVSVSQYYSGELEIYVRDVLQIIPKMMFNKMTRIIEMQTSVLKELPTRLDKEKLKDYAQLQERFEFAELTHSIALFSQGMRMMKSTLVGVICLDPKKLLEDGIRKELVLCISKALHTGFIFNAKPKPDELQTKLVALGHIMDGYKRSFEYIQVSICTSGLYFNF